MNKFQSTLIAAAAGVAVAGLAGAASAAESDAMPPQAVVRYSADTFATDAGAKAFYHQLVKASQRVCGHESSPTAFVSSSVSACRKQAMQGALAQVKNTRLAAIAGRSKGA